MISNMAVFFPLTDRMKWTITSGVMLNSQNTPRHQLFPALKQETVKATISPIVTEKIDPITLGQIVRTLFAVLWAFTQSDVYRLGPRWLVSIISLLQLNWAGCGGGARSKPEKCLGEKSLHNVAFDLEAPRRARHNETEWFRKWSNGERRPAVAYCPGSGHDANDRFRNGNISFCDCWCVRGGDSGAIEWVHGVSFPVQL